MEPTDIKIKKAKLAKGGCLEAVYYDADGNEITIKGSNKCHNDLKVALSAIVPYFADLTEQKEADSIDWNDLESAANVDLLRNIEVTGVSMGGDDTNPIVTVTGKRRLMTSRVLNLNSPGVELESETFEWSHMDEFDIAVEGFFYEAKQYILNRKWDDAQTTLDFDANAEDPFAGVEVGEMPEFKADNVA